MLAVINNLSIRTKITSAFAGVILVIAGLGATSIQRASTTNGMVRDMLDNYVGSLVFLDEMRGDILRTRVYLNRELTEAADPAAMSDRERKLDALADGYHTADTSYGATVTPGQESALYEQIRTSASAFFSQAAEVRAFIRNGKIEEAKAELAKLFGPGAEKLDVALHDDFTLNNSGATLLASAAASAYDEGRLLVIACLVGAVVMALAFAIFLVTSIASPIKAMTDVMRRLAGKDTGVVVPAREREDEVGRMAQAVEVFKQSMIETDRLRGEQEALKQRTAAEQKALLHRMADGFESKVGGAVRLLASGATELTSTAKILTNAADQSTRQATVVASAAEEASAGVQTVAAAAEELSASIGEISRQVAQSAKMTAKAVADAQRTDGMVRALSDGAQKIGAVVELITNIAGQTNLLALNATIEAARAGDAGKGFAVVASEVKNLATQTAKATEEISGQIQQIQNATKDAVEAIRGITGTIDQISQTATTIASAVEEQGAATGEIARNVQQTSQATSQVTQTMSGVSQAAGETGSAAGQVLHVATDVSRQAEMLSSEVGRFLAEVRAA